MSSEESFKILIASDVHLGHGELHPICGQDSFRAFEEVLQAADKHKVDFILLAGDLFDKNKPSFYTINKAFELIRKHCLGDREDCGDDKDEETQGRNYEIHSIEEVNLNDANINVKYPIFTIHGNHDDPTGVTQMSIVDVFHSSGMVNYFGKRDSVDEVKMSPIIFTKNRTKIALYGLGAIHEERLQHLITREKLNYLVPEENSEQFFNLVVVHQNRIPRPNTCYLHPRDLQEVPNLVIWGHEHECVDLEFFQEKNFFIYQPGSTVATSLCDGEAGAKCYAILDVDYDSKKKKPKFKLTKHELKSVRPFDIKTISVEEDILPSLPSRAKTPEAVQKFIIQYCKNEIEDMIQEAKQSSENVLEPLIRLRVQYTDPVYNLNTIHICSHFRNKGVAKWEELVRFVKKNSAMSKYSQVMDDKGEDFDFEEMTSVLNRSKIENRMGLEGIVKDYFHNVTNKDQKLGVFAEQYLTRKVQDFVQKGNNDALDKLFDNYKEVIINNIDFDHFDTDNPESEIMKVCKNLTKDTELVAQIGTSIGKKLRKIKTNGASMDSETEEETDEEEETKKDEAKDESMSD